MGVIILFMAIIPVLLLCILPSAMVFNKLKRKGEDPWPWAIITFIASGVILIGGLILIINNIPFER